MLALLNDCIGSLLHLGPNVITFKALLHLGPNVITFRTLLHLGQLLHLGLQHTDPPPKAHCFYFNRMEDHFKILRVLNFEFRFFIRPRSIYVFTFPHLMKIGIRIFFCSGKKLQIWFFILYEIANILDLLP